MTRRARGELAIVLHAHMPYVEGFGTWPFGEEWLWEAMATSYLPVLALLDRLGAGRTHDELTLSVTPVLCDQLTAPGVERRCVEFLRSVRSQSHQLDIDGFRAAGDLEAVRELESSAQTYAHAADRIARGEPTGLSLWSAMRRHATWTSSATHAVLPLLMLDESIEYQIDSGIEGFRQRGGDADGWKGGFWLPECAYEPRLDRQLTEAGVRHTCVELTGLFGPGSTRHLCPIQVTGGPALWPVDRQIVDLVWGQNGYPSNGAYRDYHRRTVHGHHVWANDGSHYDRTRALEQVRHDARAFVAAVTQRVADGGVCVFAIDTELLGHWWYEGPQWLEAVIAEANAKSLPLTALDDAAAERHAPVRTPLRADLGAISWGTGNDLRTWSGPKVADYAWRARRAELETFMPDGGGSPSGRAIRELLALQSSDWAFLADREWAADYPERRAAGHAQALQQALHESRDDRDQPSSAGALPAGRHEAGTARNLAPWLVSAAPTMVHKDGRRWRLARQGDVDWIREGTAISRAIESAVPLRYEAYATIVAPDMEPIDPASGLPGPVDEDVHGAAIMALLTAASPDVPWWLGYLDTGAADIVFPDSPKVSLYAGWNYIVVEAGSEQAGSWRKEYKDPDRRNQVLVQIAVNCEGRRLSSAEIELRLTEARARHERWLREPPETIDAFSTLPDLIYPADRSWFYTLLWDDGWSSIGGSQAFIDGFLHDPVLGPRARQVKPGEKADPPGYPSEHDG